MIIGLLVMGRFTFVEVLSFRIDAGRQPLRRVAAGIYTDQQLLSAHPRFARALLDVLRHSGRQTHDRVASENFDAANVSGVDARLVRDRADDVAGLNAVVVADLDAIPDTGGVIARGTPSPLVARRGIGGLASAPSGTRRAFEAMRVARVGGRGRRRQCRAPPPRESD